MSQDQTTHDVHVERAKQIADALDSRDVEQTLHEQFYAEFKAWEAEDQTRTQAGFDRAIGRKDNYTRRIVQFVTGATSTPWGNAPQVKRDERAARKTLRDQPQSVASDIAKAMEDPDVREAVAKHMPPSAARDLSERVSKDHPALRKLDEPLDIPEPNVSYEVRMAGPLVRVHDAIDLFIQAHEKYSDAASEDELESVRDRLAGEIARAQAAIADWSIR